MIQSCYGHAKKSEAGLFVFTDPWLIGDTVTNHARDAGMVQSTT
jgi:hypothetical protein